MTRAARADSGTLFEKGLIMKLDLEAMFAQFAAFGVQFEDTKAKERWLLDFDHASCLEGGDCRQVYLRAASNREHSCRHV